jgi:enterochelin esterase family protein
MPSGPHVTARQVTFRLADPDRRYAAVRLGQDLHLPADALAFRRVRGGWELRLALPPVVRMDYRFEVTHAADGTAETIDDPANPRGAVELPGYREPAWVTADAPPGTRRELAVRAPGLDADVHVTLWTPAGLADDEPAPLLLAHDGPEYDRAARLTHFLAVQAAAGAVPDTRAALLDPGVRDTWYAADAAYADDLVGVVVPALTTLAPTTTRIGMGTSLGALAMLHAHRTHPRVADRLFLQSGSFFDPRHDAHEARFAGYPRIVTFVAAARKGPAGRPVPVTMTCGAVEENVHNNRLLATALAAQGYDVALHEVDDVHNFTAWRDAFDPFLTDLLASAS